MNFPMIVATHHKARNCRDKATHIISQEINTADSAWHATKKTRQPKLPRVKIDQGTD
jgi:hypothetical protein